MKAVIAHRSRPTVAPVRAAAASRGVSLVGAACAPLPARGEDIARFVDACRRLADHATLGRKSADSLWRAFTEAAMQLLGSTRGGVYLLDPHDATYVPVCARGLTPHQQSLVAAHRIPVGGTVLLQRVESTRKPVVATAGEGVFSSVTRAFGVRTLLLVPLAGGRTCAGFFATDGGEIALHFPPALRDAVAEGGARVADALELALLRRQEEQHTDELALERGLSSLFAHTATIEELTAGLGEELQRFLAVESVAVEWNLSETPAGRRGWRTTCRRAGERGDAPTLCVPITHIGSLAGTLHVHGAMPRHLVPRLRLAQDAASRAAVVALRLQRLAELERLATRDPLTGLINRREFVHRLDGELARARREGVALTVLYLDLDDLKGLNDRVGHPTVDVALLEMAQRMTARARASDVVARLGGDEFALILPHTGAHGGLVLFTTLLEAMRDVIVDGHQGALSVSGGLATYPTHGGNADTLLRAADVALYSAKRSGKGSACIAEGGRPPQK